MRRGSLSINSIPWSNLWLDDRPLGHTPRLRIAVAAGRHPVRLPSASGDERTRIVEIRPAQESRLTVLFAEP